MIRKSDLNELMQEMNEEDRRRLGDPPTFDEMLAYTRGELAGADEERVRELMVAYPELARTVTEPFVPAEPAKVSPFRHAWTALAAVLAIAFAGLYFQAESKLTAPRITSSEQVLLPDGRRGVDEPATLSAQGDSYLLIATLINEQRFPHYRLEIVDAKGTSLWTRSDAQPRNDDTFALVVPRAFLAPGTYQIVVSGVDGVRQEKITSYTVRVPKT